MAHCNEKVIGFDLRINGDVEAAEWTPARRAQYLLRLDVKIPLSTDVWVWGSVLHPDRSRTLSYDKALLSRQVQAALAPTPWLVALTLLVEPGQPEKTTMWCEAFMPPEPETPLPDWILLGYDVADASLLSGLSNCGYMPEERQPLQQRFTQQLNRFHLFNDLDQAFAFKAETNKRVPEHAPFFVYGLYRIPSLPPPCSPTP